MNSERQIAEAFPPGEFLREEIEARGWSQIDLAEILGRPARVINEVIAGKRGITPETARGLGEAFGTGAEYWMNLENAYQLWRIKSSDDTVARRARIYSKAPVKEMIRRGWIERSDNVDILEKSLATFLCIDRIDAEPRDLAHAARKSTNYEEVTPAQRAWLYRVRQLAAAVPISGRYREDALDECVAQLRSLLTHPQETRHVPRVLSNFGIRFLVVEHLAQTRIDGVSLWLDAAAPVIALSMRFDRIDWFWHTLMHEMGHIKNRDGLQERAALDLDLFDEDTGAVLGKALEKEQLVNRFAMETLVPQDRLSDFVNRVSPLFSTQRIVLFAQSLRIHPGIVVGQLQRRQDGIGYHHSRKLLEKVRDIVVGSALTDGWGQRISA